MKKSLFSIVTLAFLILFTSAYSITPADGRVGYQAPDFKVSNSDTTISLQRMKGKYVLLTFWSSTDAESRISNMRYDKAAGRSEKFVHLSVNLDRSKNVYNEIIKVDNLAKATQFYCNDAIKSKISKSWRLNNGFASFLIDPTGKIIEENPEISKLAQI